VAHIWICHVTYKNKSCHTYECELSHAWMGHKHTHTNTHTHTHTHTYLHTHTTVCTPTA